MGDGRSTKHGARGMGHGAWGMEHGAWSMEHGAWSMGHGAWSMSMEHCTWGMGGKMSEAAVLNLISDSIWNHHHSSVGWQRLRRSPAPKDSLNTSARESKRKGVGSN